MILLAHRGYWRTPDERNSQAAFRRAFGLGYGVELDVRDEAGRLVISHDVPEPGRPLLSFRDVLQDYRDAGHPGAIAVNIKADGLAALIEADFGLFPEARQHCFMFDMSVPETLRYVRGGHRVFTRHSEYEPVPPLIEFCDGVWMDCFEKPWVSPEDIAPILARGISAAIVSPELHGRPHAEGWAMLRAMLEEAADGPAARRSLMLCTDFPQAAEEAFAGLETV